MKTLLLIFIITLFPFVSNAECYYTNFHLQFEIETDSNTIVCYNEISACEFDIDSISNQAYLLRALSTLDSPTNISVYKTRLNYSYCIETTTNCLDNEKDTIYKLLNPVTLSLTTIKNIKVVDYRKKSSMLDIASKMTLSDTSWIYQKPIEVIGIWFELCASQIFIYQQNKDYNPLISEMKAFQAKVNAIEISNKELTSEEEKKYYNKMNALIDQIILDEKVVVITECTD